MQQNPCRLVGRSRTRLSLEGVGELDEQLALRAGKLLALVESALVPVAKEQRRLPVDAVAEESGAREARALAGNRDEVQRWIPPGADVLADEAEEGARVEVVGGLQALHPRGEEARAPAGLAVDVEPGHRAVGVERQVIRGP